MSAFQKQSPTAPRAPRRRKRRSPASIFSAGSIPLARISGISIRVHPTFAILMAYFAWIGYSTPPGGWMGILAAESLLLLIFVCVCLHELGHSLVAQRFGVEVQSITLLPIGGMAALKRIPENPMQEIAITVAGPMVNLVIAVGLALWLGLSHLTNFNLQFAFGFGELGVQLLVVNVLMFVFNLIPAFPMDGGRLLRAVLAFWMPYVRATSVAAVIGQAIAALFIFVALLQWPDVMWLLALVGAFIIFAAGSEERIVKTRAALSSVRVEQVMRCQFQTLVPADTVADALDMSFQNEQEVFPVLMADRYIGIVSRTSLLDNLAENGPRALVVLSVDDQVPTVAPEDSGTTAFEKIMTSGRGTLPVLQGDSLVGLVSVQALERCVKMGGICGALKQRAIQSVATAKDLQPPPPPHPADDEFKPSGMPSAVPRPTDSSQQ